MGKAKKSTIAKRRQRKRQRQKKMEQLDSRHRHRQVPHSSRWPVINSSDSPAKQETVDNVSADQLAIKVVHVCGRGR